MITSFVILGLMLAMSACSKQSSKSALVGVSSPVPVRNVGGANRSQFHTCRRRRLNFARQKTRKKRPANVT